MSQIIIHPKSQFERVDIEKLAEAIKNIDSKIEIKYVDSKRIGYGVTWWEVIYVFIGYEVSKTIISELTKATLKWAKDRLNEKGDYKRPQYISIFGGDGIPIKAMLVNTTGEIEDKTEDARKQGAEKIPPLE
jgi:translation elongation factor EF-1beta